MAIKQKPQDFSRGFSFCVQMELVSYNFEYRDSIFFGFNDVVALGYKTYRTAGLTV